MKFLNLQGGVLMGEIRVDGQDGSGVSGPEEMAGRFHAELFMRLPGWKQQLAEAPDQLSDLEREVHAAFAGGADLLVAGLLAEVMKQPSFDEACEQTRRHYRYPLCRGRKRPLQVRLLGGLLLWVTSLYCAPAKRRFRKPDQPVAGLHVELAQFGFGKGCSPALESRVSRKAALCPSFELAQQELEREGVRMDVKTVRRITYQCGSGLLALRTHELMQWRSKALAAGVELRGKRVTVQIDGGRTKIRGALRAAPARAEKTDDAGLPVENRPGRSKRRARKTYAAEWREPKLVTIFVHEDTGRMLKGSRATIEGTFQGPDAMAELVAMHLHRLGAAGATSVTFVADGASWIWDRIPTIVRKAGLENVPIYEVLDCCHAAHHISLALAAIGMSEQERMPLYREHRTLLRNGQWRRVVEELTGVAELHPANEKIQTEIAYLTKHGEAGRLKYPTFRARGLPLGSGAIESSIRRVINLRLKGNGIFWYEGNAEEMLQVRAQVVTNRWDERMARKRQHLRYDGWSDWQWEPLPMSCKT
jgi:hypothetical protein